MRATDNAGHALFAPAIPGHRSVVSELFLACKYVKSREFEGTATALNQKGCGYNPSAVKRIGQEV